MIYTSYFGKLKKLPKNVFPVAICASTPSWYTGARYPKLAPDYEKLMQWKCDHNDDDYARCFHQSVLGKLDVIRTADELHMLLPEEARIQMQCPVWRSPDWHIALVCYEKPSDFCHRHFVADWLWRGGFKCKEWEETYICEATDAGND